MPAHHRFKADWTPERIRRQAARIGPNTEAFVEVIMRERRHPEQGYHSCLGVMRLAKTFGRDRLEAACERAVDINARSYSSLHSILKNGLPSHGLQANHCRVTDRQHRTRATPSRACKSMHCLIIDEPAITHPNIRGADYVH